MKSRLLAKASVIFMLSSACVFLSGTEVIVRSSNSDVQSIVLEKDDLTIKSKDGKVYIYKISELLKSESQKTQAVQTAKAAPGSLEEAFATNGVWCFFDNQSSRLNRLKYLKRNDYKVFKEGELLEMVLYNAKYYARDLDSNIYVPHWEVGKNFSPHLVPAEKHLAYLEKKLGLLEEEINKSNHKISKAQHDLKSDRAKYIKLLRFSDHTVKVDKDGNVIKTHNSYSSEIKSQLRRYEKSIKKQEKALKDFEKELGKLEKQQRNLSAQKNKLKNLYMKYCGTHK